MEIAFGGELGPSPSIRNIRRHMIATRAQAQWKVVAGSLA